MDNLYFYHVLIFWKIVCTFDTVNVKCNKNNFSSRVDEKMFGKVCTSVGLGTKEKFKGFIYFNEFYGKSEILCLCNEFTYWKLNKFILFAHYKALFLVRMVAKRN